MRPFSPTTCFQSSALFNFIVPNNFLSSLNIPIPSYFIVCCIPPPYAQIAYRGLFQQDLSRSCEASGSASLLCFKVGILHSGKNDSKAHFKYKAWRSRQSSALHIILFALTSHLSSKFLARTVNLEFNLHKRKKKMQHGTSKIAEFSYSPLHIVTTN